MSPSDNLLIRALTTATDVTRFSEQDWDLLLRLARRDALLARLALALDETGGVSQLPARVQDHLTAAKAVAADNERMVRWEVDRIGVALAHIETPVVLLKGAAYVMAELPPARGRLAADVDIMVPRCFLSAVETALKGAGWVDTKLDSYDQHYYRTWMHELPPLVHKLRNTTVDVHHTILPLTSRLSPDADRLFESAVPLDGTNFMTLAPAHMVLHSAVHLFHDGDIEHGLRDLVDLHDLLTHFGQEPAFWPRLLASGRLLGLQRPLFYATRYCQRLLGTAIPTDVLDALRGEGPRWRSERLMDALVDRVMTPSDPDRPPRGRGLARWLLYVRSHHLRMPLRLLLPHLARKAFRRRLKVAAAQ